MNIIQFLLPPVLGGIIALSTNWIAIKMLFRPHREIRLFGIRLPFTPGLIPKERSRLARKLGEAVSVHLLTPDVLANKLADPSVWPLPDATIGECIQGMGIADPVAYLESLISAPAKKAADALLPKAIDGLINFPKRFPELDQKLAEITAQIAEKSISRLAGMFVNRNKIYNNIKEAIFEYLANPENQETIRTGVMNAIDSLITAKAPELNAAETPDETSQAAPITPASILPALFNASNNNRAICEHICAFHIRDGANIIFQQEPYASMVRRVLEVAATYLATHMPIADMIEQKMGGLDIADTERVILSVVGRELKLIVMLGGLFGFLIGLLSLVLPG
ncbi:MAG: DUF445 family protein [Defluviitaleaceae bacterium]|nr:DUF445 family protein [Defluviitaleaceae bacterium]